MMTNYSNLKAWMERKFGTSHAFDKYCDNREIFFIEDRDGFYWINGANGYYKSDWTLEEAVKDYNSEKGKARRLRQANYRKLRQPKSII